MKEESSQQHPIPESDVALQAELEYLRDVYNAIRGEIRNDENKIKDTINYTLAGVGGIAAIASLIANTNQYVLFLVLPFIFIILALESYTYHIGIFRLGTYLIQFVYPRIRTVITKLNGGKYDFGDFAIDWEVYRRKYDLRGLFRLPLSASSFGLQLLASPFPVVLFFYYKQSSQQPLYTLEIAFLVIDITAFLITLAYLIAFPALTRKWGKDVLEDYKVDRH